MNELHFTGNSIKEWRIFKKFYRERFWEELEDRKMKDIKMLIQEQIYEEFNMQIGANRYQRNKTRKGYRHGYRMRSFEVMGGLISDLIIPRARKLDIRFSIFDKWERVQDKILLAMTKAYLLGRSASCAQQIIQAFGQSRFSRSFLQRLVKKFENNLKEFRYRKISKKFKYIFLDGMSIKMLDVNFKEKIIIFAYGMDDNRKFELLGWVVADSEDEVSVRGLLIDLKNRGLCCPELFISDESKGIKSALKLEYPHVEHQLCCFHKVKNIQNNLKDIKNRKNILREAADIYNCSTNKTEAIKLFKKFEKNWKYIEPEAVRLFSRNFEYTLRYFDYPEHIWKSVRTSNPIEQFIGKLRCWFSRFNYFHGRANLDLAIFTYLCFKKDELVPDKYQPENQKYTLFVA